MEKFNRYFEYIKSLFHASLRHFLKIYKDLSIRFKFIVIFNVIVIVPLIFIGYTSYKNSENVIKNNSIQYSQDVLKMIELRLNDNIVNLNMISLNAIVDSRIYGPIDGSSANGKPNEQDYQEMGEYLRNIIMNVNEVQSVGILSESGDYISADNNHTKISIKNIMPQGSKLLNYIKDAAELGGGAPVWYINKQGETVNILYARTIYDQNNYNEIGLMVILVNSDYFNSVFQNLQNKDMQNVAVIATQNGVNQVILSKKNTNIQMLSQDVLKKMNNDGWFLDKKNNLLITYTQMQNPSWKVVSYVPLGELYQDISDLRQKILISCILTVIIISLFSSYMAYDLITAINKLISGMKKVQQGDENVSIELGRKDEIGYMGSTFNSMVSEISMLEKWVYREQLTRKDAEIKSLQAQINPHFLFNTLESINWMAQLENAPSISNMVTALASLMEANMSKDDKIISLKKELEYIDNYMLIMKNRFEDRLELKKDIDPDSLDIEVPRLIIQPLIENAVYHGVGNIRGKGVIKLTTRTENELLTITVEDNGSGIEPEKLEVLNKGLQMDDESYFENLEKKHTGGIGLENVNRRIRLYYGSEYGIKIESKLGEYTRILLRIPVLP
jgi:two-component system sensor histidine kinase YesM